MGGLFSSPPVFVVRGERPSQVSRLARSCALRSGMKNQEQYERGDDNSNDDEDHGWAGEARSLLRRQDGRIHGRLDADQAWTGFREKSSFEVIGR